MRKLLLLFAGVLLLSNLYAQQPFTVHVNPSSFTAVPPLHSGAFAVYQGKWIFIGGRIDGIHNMQANQAFPAYNRNDSIFIYDPATNTRKAATATQLPGELYGALASANMQFYQDGSKLYMVGGYGWVDSLFTWRTYPMLISVNLDSLIPAVENASSLNRSFRYIIDTTMAVAGGAMEKIGNDYKLVFGHRFDGFYTRQNSGAFSQRYTEAIRTFTIVDDSTGLSIANYTSVTDTNFHRRDYNLVPQVFPDLSYGLTAFGGVFKRNIDLPFHTPIDIQNGTYQHQSSFNQNLVQYTTAVLPIYDSLNNYMHSVFLGGMSLFTLDTINNVLTRDTLVPFTRAISKVSRDGSGNLTESQLPGLLPKYLSNAFFIPLDSAPFFAEKVFDLNAMSGNQLVGYLVGGIEADDKNVADLDPNGLSRPAAMVYEVYIDKRTVGINETKIPAGLNDVVLFPNPVKEHLNVKFSLPEVSNCEIDLYSIEGKLLRNLYSGNRIFGDQAFDFNLSGLKSGTYQCKIKAGAASKVIRFVVQN